MIAASIFFCERKASSFLVRWEMTLFMDRKGKTRRGCCQGEHAVGLFYVSIDIEIGMVILPYRKRKEA